MLHRLIAVRILAHSGLQHLTDFMDHGAIGTDPIFVASGKELIQLANKSRLTADQINEAPEYHEKPTRYTATNCLL